MHEQEKRTIILPIVLTILAVLGFLSFVYGYPLIFPDIEKRHPDNFEENVAESIAEGDMKNALRVMRFATSWHTLEPKAHTLYGQLLLQDGQTTEGLARLNHVFTLRQEPPPFYRRTWKTYFFAPARLTLGTYYLDQGDALRAVTHYELARAYANLSHQQYEEYASALYQAYSRCGLWGRALKFGEPAETELNRLSDPVLVTIARICEGRQDWQLAEKACEELLARNKRHPEAHYILGKTLFVKGALEESLSHFDAAADEGHPDAPFFAGLALREAGDPARSSRAFLQTPAESLYRVFAIAMAITAFPETPQHTLEEVPFRREEMLAQLDNELARQGPIRDLAIYDRYPPYIPVALDMARAYSDAGGPFPVLLVWEGRGLLEGDAPKPLSVNVGDDWSVTLRRGLWFARLEWVVNKAYWSPVETFEPGSVNVPGWVDIARDWYDLRDTPVTLTSTEEDGNRFVRITNDDINKLAWLYSPPITVHRGSCYILAGRLRAPVTKGCLGWQCLDGNERVISEDYVFDQVKTQEWTWGAAFLRAPPFWDTIRLELGVTRHAGTAEFDDIMLLEVQRPMDG